MTKESFINLSPSPASLIASLRDIGYSMETAIADVIDNSITAKASHINIRFAWNSGDPWIGIIDDGRGMTDGELIEAMRFGSMNPSEKRLIDDLGRFGLGMKTASFSQCRHLTVLSKKDIHVSACEWDLEKIAEDEEGRWLLGIIHEIEQRDTLSSLYNENLLEHETGTIVLWERFDRISDQLSNKHKEKYFNSLIDDVRKHLGLVFHRFISPEPGRKRITISINGDDVEAFNPFNPKNLATQELTEQRFFLDGEKIIVQPYVLPHHNKTSRQEYDQYAGEGGYLHNQGFYIYRNKRLIIKGTWFRLIKKEELNKLIRIKIDIPNTLDHLWKLDVKKSSASPPESIKKELRQVIERIEVAGRKVYKQRGSKLSSTVTTPVWNRKAIGGNIIYEINRGYPLLTRLLDRSSPEQSELIKDLISVFESSFPVDMFFNDVASRPETVERPEFPENHFEKLFDTFVSFWESTGSSTLEIASNFLSTEPFVSQRDLTEAMLKQKGYSS